MNNIILNVIKENDVNTTLENIINELIKIYKIKNYIKDFKLKSFENDALGIYNFESKSLYINKKIINILNKYYDNSKSIKIYMTKEEFIIFEILQTIIHETIHARQNKIIIEEKGIIHKVFKDILHTPGRMNELYELDPLEKDAELTSYEFLFPYYHDNKNIDSFLKDKYNNKLIYRGYFKNDLTKGSLEKLYRLFLLKEDKFEKLKSDLNILSSIEKLHLNYSLSENDIKKLKVK